MRKQLLLGAVIAALLLNTLPTKAQEYHENHTSDIQMHSVTQVSGRISDRWSYVWGEEFFFGNNISEFQKLYSRITLNYTLLPNLTISPMLMHVGNHSKNTHTMVYELLVGYAIPCDRLRLSFRTGLRTYDPLYDTNTNPLLVKVGTEHQWRTQVGLTYRLSSLLEPFANIENFLLLNPVSHTTADNTTHTVGLYLPRVRSNVGVKFHIDSHNALSLYWCYDHTQNKYLSYELGGGNYGIFTSSNTCNFVGVRYDYKF